MGRLVVLGSASQDLHLEMPRHPHTGETVLSGDIEYRFGGKGGNQSVAGARAGVECAFVGRLGDDAPGREYIRRLEAYGVDTSHITLDASAPTGTAIIYINDERDNMIVVAPGANSLVGEHELGALDGLSAGDVLLMPLEIPLDIVERAAVTAKGHGATVVINMAPYAAVSAHTLENTDLVIVNEHEDALMREDGLQPADVLVTLGAEGSRWGDVVVPAERVTPLDTTGAGDAYCGTLAACLARGDSRQEAMQAATRAAAANVQHHGAQPPLG